MDDIDPYVKLYMYESWCQDLIDKHEFAKNYSIFIGGFSNPELAQKIIKDREEGTMHKLSDDEFEESTRMVLADRERWLKEQKEQKKPKRKRRVRRVMNKA